MCLMFFVILQKFLKYLRRQQNYNIISLKIKPGTLLKTSQPIWIFVRGSTSTWFPDGIILLYLKSDQWEEPVNDFVYEHYFLLRSRSVKPRCFSPGI